MTWHDWAEVPLPVWIMIGILAGGMVVLAFCYSRLANRHDRLFLSVSGIDTDLDEAEKELKRVGIVLTRNTQMLREVKEACDAVTRQPVRPNVPATDPVMRAVASPGKHSLERMKFPKFPYGD